MSEARICNGCGKTETEQQYFNQMRYRLPIYYTTFFYDKDVDLCTSCKTKISKSIAEHIKLKK